MLTQLPRYIDQTTGRSINPKLAAKAQKQYFSDKRSKGINNSSKNTLKDGVISDHKTFISAQKITYKKQRLEHLNNTAFAQRLHSSRYVFRQAHQAMHNMMLNLSRHQEIDKGNLLKLVQKIIHHTEYQKDIFLYVCREKKPIEYSFMRCISFCALMISFAREVGYQGQDLLDIGMGAILHDSGKLRLSQAILNKSGKLSAKEFQDVKKHTQFSEIIFHQLKINQPLSINIAKQHHERIDGMGYPKGLRENSISDIGQMAAIADVYDAYTSKRNYRKAQEPTTALSYLLSHPNKFNSDLVKHFIRIIGIYPVGSIVKLNNGLLGVVIKQNENLLKPVIKAFYDSATQSRIESIQIDMQNFQTSNNELPVQPLQSNAKWQRLINQIL